MTDTTINDNTIWRDLVPANFLSKDYFEAEQNRVFTIAKVEYEEIENPANRKKDSVMTIYDKGELPPLVCNKTNARTIQQLAGTPKIKKWIGLRIYLYFDPTVRFGREVIGGIRVRPYLPEPDTKPEAPLCTDCKQIVPEHQGVPGHTIAEAYKKHYGVPLCYECGQKRKQAAEVNDAANE